MITSLKTAIDDNFAPTKKNNMMSKSNIWINESGILQAAVQGELWRLRDSNGKPPGLIGLKPENAVTFIDNHDTWSQNLWPFPREKVMLGYVYILTHPGTPTIVLLLHFFFSLYILSLIRIRGNKQSISCSFAVLWSPDWLGAKGANKQAEWD